ncbi:heme ABC exporter ATP-binding protein CcmA [Citromicrobium sp. JLT1363]|uniref:heme ABC exporter ATP-binding protein CcmA n=1 Tax=Citromicrobium sp. JLT1363 TaxID=517722 RepID=UPI000225E762|nr:heme ABC exporter ATP-binding protein CcmA [Citromicrobium sp. JLT1363]
MQARLLATNIACLRGERLLFRKLGLDLGPGDLLQLRGPNGIGKSSLLRILAGLARPSAGTIERGGEIGLMDGRHALDSDRTLGDALAFWARLDGCADTAKPMARLGIDTLADIPTAYLSTGQKQRAVIARLLFRARPIWLLDEPFAGLDSASQTLLAELVAEHCGAGGLCVFVSHQPADLPARTLDLADHTA